MGMDSGGISEDRSKTIKIACNGPIYSVSFVKDGTQVLSGGAEGALRRWGVHDGYMVGQPTHVEGAKIFATALSPDHELLVCGFGRSERSGLGSCGAARALKGIWARVWDARNLHKIMDIKSHSDTVFSVDFSHDSTKFATGSADKLAYIWSRKTRAKLVGPLQHEGAVVAVRFSPSSERVATATAKNQRDTTGSIRIYDSESGQCQLSIPFLVHAHISSSLAWSANGLQLYAVAYATVSRFDMPPSPFELLHQWSVPGDGSSASIALSRNQKFIVVVANQSLSFWDAMTYEQIGTVIQHASTVWSMALSANDDCIATGEKTGRITLRCLRDVLPGPYFTTKVSVLQLPLLNINDAAFKSWAQGDLTRAEELLTEEIRYPFCRAHSLTQRALVRARLKKWNMAIVDAVESINVQQSDIGHIAGAMAHIGNGGHDLVMPVFDTGNRFLLVIEAIILFKCGQHDEAIMRVENMIKDVDSDDRSLYLTVLAQMFLIRGGVLLREGESEQALRFFKHAKEAIPVQNDPYLVVISLIFGWDFDKLDQEVKQYLQECIKAFEGNGDAALQSKNPEEAIQQYSTALSLEPLNPAGCLVKRSKARATLRLWEDALMDADEAIKADPLSPWGYESRRAVLHALQRYDDAVDALTRMFSVIEESLDKDIYWRKYVPPSLSRTTIESIALEVSKICPIFLIDVESGRLCDKSERVRTFKLDSQFNELVSSMAEEDNGHTHEVVKRYFKYVTFSHVWAGKEPSFQDIQTAESGSVRNLDSSPLNQKLKKFCEMVQKDGYRWAWSDTCCIDKTNSTELNRSLMMMYQWYEASAATFVLLADVDSLSPWGKLKKSKWMTRAWTAQELLAPSVIRFYDCNWEPYLEDTHNHKDSPKILEELADAIGVTREVINQFHPDDLSIRERLQLASGREATEKEDIAYSLIGIFKSDIRPYYGEGDAALGHLLEDIVTRSGDVTVLDWAGNSSSSYNSCLPATLSVYSKKPCAAPTVKATEADVRVAALRNPISRSEAMTVYSQVTDLPSACFSSRKLHLPCIVFAVETLQKLDFGSRQEYHALVPGIGYVDFETSDKFSLSEAHDLVVVHPWILAETKTEARSASDSSMDGSYARALRLIARLKQPFHVLLLQRQPCGKFKRVAAGHEIVVQGLDPRINFARDIRIEVVEVL